jgi:DNA-binding transcriptional LysR family regulator
MDRMAAMRALVHVVDTGSFSAAARQLGLGQPAVSKTIAALEERLGVRLLTRTTRGLTPTEAGLRFCERARRSLDEADEADLAARGEGAGLTGLLRVSAATTFARLHIVPALGDFLAAHPGLELELILDDRRIDLVEEGIDVSFRMGDLSDSAAMARRLATGPRRILATPDYLAAEGEPRHPSDLARRPVILSSRARAEVWEFEREDQQFAVPVQGRLRFSGAEGVRAAVRAHLGLALASVWMFAPELASGAVRPVLADWTLPSIDLWAVYPTGRLVSAKARAFADFVAGVIPTP